MTPHWKEASNWMLFNLFGLLLPAAFSAITVIGLRHSVDLAFFTDAGQFAIYSVALWVTVLYLIVRQTPKRLRFEIGLAVGLLLGYLTSLSGFLLAALASVGIPIDHALLQWPTITLFIVTVVCTLWAVAQDNKRMSFDPISDSHEQLTSLQSEFEK